MKPYQLHKDGEWVDLSAIQSIEPPTILDKMGYGGYFAVMRWRVAFQDRPRELVWEQELEGKDKFPLVDEHGVPTAVAKMKREVFEPLLEAWANQAD